jgi:hypothetical protein
MKKLLWHFYYYYLKKAPIQGGKRDNLTYLGLVIYTLFYGKAHKRELVLFYLLQFTFKKDRAIESTALLYPSALPTDHCPWYFGQTPRSHS